MLRYSLRLLEQVGKLIGLLRIPVVVIHFFNSSKIDVAELEVLELHHAKKPPEHISVRVRECRRDVEHISAG